MLLNNLPNWPCLTQAAATKLNELRVSDCRNQIGCISKLMCFRIVESVRQTRVGSVLPATLVQMVNLQSTHIRARQPAAI
jgi:hypothetical protein